MHIGLGFMNSGLGLNCLQKISSFVKEIPLGLEDNTDIIEADGMELDDENSKRLIEKK